MRQTWALCLSWWMLKIYCSLGIFMKGGANSTKMKVGNQKKGKNKTKGVLLVHMPKQPAKG